MKTPHPPQAAKRSCTDAARRALLLAAFDRSGLSAAAFARQRKLAYTTFCGWCQQRARAHSSPAFVQVELPTPIPPTELVVEWGAHVRVRVQSASQVELAAALLQRLAGGGSC